VARPLSEGHDWSIGEYVCTAGPHDRPFEERHEQVAIAAVIEGSFSYRGDTGTAMLYSGALLLGNAGTCYECSHAHSTGDRCIALHVSPAYFHEIAASRAGSGRFKFPTAVLPDVAKVLPWLAWIEARAARAERLEIDEAVPRFAQAVIGVLSDAGSTPTSPSARDERRISEVLRYIDLHATEPLSLNALARVAAISKYHFLRTFHRSAGMTPYQYLLGVRLRRAAVRLATSSEPVSAIAFETGFGDLSTFNGRFREVFGASPTAYRRCERSTWRPSAGSQSRSSGA
jgi:AraC-like DNA-binding protein